MSIDLHIHSTFSDGTLTPTELVKMAAYRKLQTISITDHDTMDGVSEAFVAGRQYGVEIISGLECSVEFNGLYMHLLGYFQDISNPVLNEKLLKVQSAREERNIKIVGRLQTFGIDISYDEVLAVSGDGQTGRPHIGRVMIEKGVVKNLDQAFNEFLGKKGKAYVSRFVYPVGEAIRHITEAGGLAVLAHPAQIDYSLKILPDLVEELTRYGLDGLEVYYPSHSSKITKKLRKICDDYDLVLTGGSDYHGDIRENTSLAGKKGLRIPAELVEAMKKRLAKRAIRTVI